MIIKVPFEMLHVTLEKVYDNIKSEKDLDKSALVIEAIITSLGWDVDEYLDRAYRLD